MALTTAALFVCGGASAQPIGTNLKHGLRDFDVDGRFVEPASEGAGVAHRRAIDGASVAERSVGLDSAYGALRRGSYGARGAQPVLEMYDDAEGLPLFPATFNNTFIPTTWVNHPLDDDTPNFWQSQIPAFAHASDEEIGGNATRKVRLFTAQGQDPDLFFTGWRVNLVREVTGPTTFNRLVLRPDPSQPLRAGHDAWNSNIEALWSSEIIYASSGFIMDRLLWGGTCNEPDCPDFGLPFGPIEHYYSLNQDYLSIFQICEFIGAAPPGHKVGDPVSVVVQSWHRIIHEIVDDIRIRIYIDYLDGQGEFLIADYPQFFQQQRLDSIRGNASYESQDATHYVDNIFAIGMEFLLPQAPPLVCGDASEGGAYLDDLEWLNPGPLKNQSPRWFDALSSKTNVDVVGSDQKIRQSNVFPDNYYRSEFHTTLPQAFAFPDNPWRFCVDARVSDDNKTVRGIALRTTASSVIDNPNVTARLFIGHTNPHVPEFVNYQPRLYAQINPGFEPIVLFGNDPTDPETFPQVGVDIIDIGPFASGGLDKTICMEVSDDDGLIVTVDGVQFGSGLSTLNSNHAVARVGFESRNNWNGTADQFRVDNVLLECAPLPLVTYPDLSLVYLDDLESYIPNVPIGAQADASSPPTRWVSSSTSYVRALGTVRGENNVLEMENIFRDTTPDVPGGPDFTFFTQATTNLPSVTFAQDDRGWVAGGSFMLTDGATTRLWRPANQGEFVDQVLIATSVAFSGVTGTFWAQRPNPNDDLNTVPATILPAVWFDTGRTPASLGVGFGEWFTLSIHMSTNGVFTYRVNNALLRDVSNDVVYSEPLRSLNSTNQLRIHRDLDRLNFLSGDDAGAPVGSVLYADDVRAWTLPCPGDANNDGVVDFADFSLVLANYGAAGLGTDAMGNIAPDADGDGVPDDNVVNFTDFTTVLSNYGNECD